MHISLDNSKVAVISDEVVGGYPPLADAPFHPSESYPEYTGREIAARPNPVYRMIRQALADLGLDAGRFGTPAWNPITDLVPPDARIVVKPNWVLHRNMGPSGTDCLVTHASVLRAVLDYVFLAKPREVVLGDAPIQGCDFGALINLGVNTVVDFFLREQRPIRLVDFRQTVLRQDDARPLFEENRRPLDEYRLVDLGVRSMLEPLSSDARKFRVTMYDPRRMWDNHGPGVHRYLIAKDVLQADLIVNVPKLKTHKKAGITSSLKNLVGVVGNKDFLPHHRKGAANCGGDNYERFSMLKSLTEAILDIANRHLHRPVLYAACSRLAYYLLVMDKKMGGSGDVEGSWYANDTVWRMCLDLNRILLWCGFDGRLRDVPQRAELSVMDAVIAGQGDGPLKPDSLLMGKVLAALNPAAGDWIATLLMGLNPHRIPIVNNSFRIQDLPIARFSPRDICCTVNGRLVTEEELAKQWTRPAHPPAGWRGHCEMNPPVRQKGRRT